MKKAVVSMLSLLVLLVATAAFAADTLNFVIMSAADPKKEGPKYEALSQYLKAGSPQLGDIQLRVAKNYTEAAQLFKTGEVEGMFSGSFVAAVFIKKGVAKPVARPLLNNGVSTYKAVVVAKEGTKPFAGIADFKGKRVAYSLLASSGEVFVRTLLAAGEKPESVYTPVPAASHQAALNAVQNDAADYAVVKNTIFKPADFKGLVQVGADADENPDNTLIMTEAAYAKYGADLSRLLLGLEADKGEKAEAVKKAFGAKAFLATTDKDFTHTFDILEKAHIDAKKFDFAF
jgi:ABC-type phosphate/phosphonate transport system substrate-binding protein